jgi:hypothetical protein
MSTDALEQLQASLQRLGRLLASRQIASRLATVAGAEVSQQGAVLLRALLRDGEQAVAALASAAAMDLGAVSRQVRLLEDAGRCGGPRTPRTVGWRSWSSRRRVDGWPRPCVPSA